MYRNLSGLGQPVLERQKRRSRDADVPCGVPGARSLRSAAPGPLCAVDRPLAARRVLPSWFVPARFRTKGQGHALAHRKLQVSKSSLSATQGSVGSDFWCASKRGVFYSYFPQWIMGIDKSLTDDFPSVDINGVTYHYGRESVHGQYLVENAEYAKDYWCFDTAEDLRAFLENLPESADKDWILKRYPNWHDVTHEERNEMMKENRAFLRKLADEKLSNGQAQYFNVLAFDEDRFFSARSNHERWDTCDQLDIEVKEVTNEKRTELLIVLRTEPMYGNQQKVLTICREQALKLAASLIKAASYIEQQSSD